MDNPLSEKYDSPRTIKYKKGKSDLPIVEISSKEAKATVSLYGAHILSFQPKGEADILWISDQSLFEEGKPIRGGIPICFPWFGPHESDPQKPLHGFARINQWEVAGTSILPEGDLQLQLILKDTPETKLIWPHSFQLEMKIMLGSALNVSLTCINTGKEVFTYSDALHAYFTVSDISKVRLHGFKGHRYYDGLENGAVKTQTEELLVIKREEIRRYFEFTDECILEDLGYYRKIHIKKDGSRVTLVWNPWSETAKKIPDMQDDGYKKMLCVESVNSNDDIVTLKPGEKHTLTTIIKSVR